MHEGDHADLPIAHIKVGLDLPSTALHVIYYNIDRLTGEGALHYKKTHFQVTLRQQPGGPPLPR